MSATAGRPLTAVLYGFGRVNRAVLELSLARPWLRVGGILVRPESDRSRRPSDIVPGADPELSLETDPEEVFRRVRPDVAIVATRPRLSDVLPHLRVAASHSRAVLCTAEELAFVDGTDGHSFAALQDLALSSRARLVAVGVNPGFLFDQWPLAAAALAWTVDRISVRRVVDAAAFPPAARRHLGIGLTADELAAGLASGAVAGHIGFHQSLRILAAGFGVNSEVTPTEMRPIFAEADVQLDGYSIPAGSSVGMEQRSGATLGGRPWIDLNLTFHARPALSGLEPMDMLDIAGRNEVHVRIPGGIRPGPATAALLVNAIPVALDASPGYHPSGTLRLGAPWLGDAPPASPRGM
jgi:hypothetical protein